MQKDTNHDEQNKKDIRVYEAVSLFIKDKEGIYLYRRAEKICKAYFLLTQHIQDSESIKAKLRGSALELASKTLNLVGTLNKLENLSRLIVLESLSLVSMSDMALTSGLISESNYLLVVRQIEIFITEVENYWKSMSYSSQAIPSTLFSVESFSQSEDFEDAVTPTATSFRDPMSFIKDIHTNKKNQTTNSYSSAGNNLTASSQSQKNIVPTAQSVSSAIPVQKINKVKEPGEKNERQTLIIETIRDKGELSIKDLTDVIKGCSEKTIQRELISLVSNGDLLKTGERRWSRYSLVK